MRTSWSTADSSPSRSSECKRGRVRQGCRSSATWASADARYGILLRTRLQAEMPDRFPRAGRGTREAAVRISGARSGKPRPAACVRSCLRRTGSRSEAPSWNSGALTVRSDLPGPIRGSPRMGSRSSTTPSVIPRRRRAGSSRSGSGPAVTSRRKFLGLGACFSWGGAGFGGLWAGWLLATGGV